MLIGRALAHGQGLHYVGVPGDPPAVKFPPGYPSVLALLWLVLGSVGPVTLAAELLNLALPGRGGGPPGLGPVPRGPGSSGRTSMGIAALAFVSADVWRWALVPLSEPLFMLLCAGALATWKAASAPDNRRGAAASRRSWSWRCSRARRASRSWRASRSPCCGRGGGARPWPSPRRPSWRRLAWGQWAAARAAEVPEGMRDVLGPYGGWLTGQILAAPATFVAKLPAHADEAGSWVFSLLLPGLTASGSGRRQSRGGARLASGWSAWPAPSLRCPGFVLAYSACCCCGPSRIAAWSPRCTPSW